MAVADSPVSTCHIPASVLAAHSSNAYLREEEALPPAEFGRARLCRTVRFASRLRQNPAGKPNGRWRVLLECSFALPQSLRLLA